MHFKSAKHSEFGTEWKTEPLGYISDFELLKDFPGHGHINLFLDHIGDIIHSAGF